MNKHLAKAVALANRLGHKKIYTEADFRDTIPLSDGCSGGLSKVYAKMGKVISCAECCHAHDWLYQLGGGYLARLRADWLLCRCAASAGKFEDWPGLFRCVWRGFRAVFMFLAVRKFGGLFWSRDPVEK